MGCMTKGRTANMEIKKALHDNIIVPTLMYANETWTWNEGQRSRIQAVETSYLTSACGLNRIDSENIEKCVWKVWYACLKFRMNCAGV